MRVLYGAGFPDRAEECSALAVRADVPRMARDLPVRLSNV